MHPLPRLSKAPEQSNDISEVLVVGAGPAGLFMTLNLAHLGLTDTSLLCIDAKSGPTPAGHADGLNGRTLEIFRTVQIEGDILRDAPSICSYASWYRPNGDPDSFHKGSEQIANTVAPARYGDYKLMQQGRLERVFLRDLFDYSTRGVQYSTQLVDVNLDETDPERPVTAVVETDGHRRTLRTKYLIAADGARSGIRQKLNIEQEGQNLPRVWGVIDIVVDTDFPDIRKFTQLPGHLGEGRGHAFIIPREKMSNGEPMTRFYVDLTDYSESTEGMSDTRAFRASITVDKIMKKVREKLHPYRVDMKKGTRPIWWAAYPIAQKTAKEQIVRDSQSHPRIFLAGDSMHSHSPSQGLGMNMGIQDAFNLSWKLAYAIHGLTVSPTSLLDTYESERRPVARRLIHLDRVWNSTGKTEQPIEARLHDMAEYMTCCGIEYGPSMLVSQPTSAAEHDSNTASRPPNSASTAHGPVSGTDYLHGVLRPGRRLLNIALRRFADGHGWDIHDDLRADGRYRAVVLATVNFPHGLRDRSAVAHVCGATVHAFVAGGAPIVEAVIVYPGSGECGWGWRDVPEAVKKHCEMRVYGAQREEYERYGVDVDRGAVVVVRPDGVVGWVGELDDVQVMDEFLGRVLRRKSVDELVDRSEAVDCDIGSRGVLCG
ncbi:FAD/NAD(P)-binding domain-containing protein [Pseudovirgaria hyperparasitica]|uniref:FAD/NAD(P)-binding domain-containing protein n=1 Tax=Pseudovirgaria hyperparasitica TaxID=470096 RepID=A0A6A6W5T7_9PEZI|nr:FAD/NAD(P)-binding domain-containing protein [Pseudovirgaria hyperparasitica]KAF2756421.1 FAD/NAD(P)-binding domain-containing protein [Pseudovirgaria hyperparasitica]